MIRTELIILHSDKGFPLEKEVSDFFMPSFWNAPDFKSWGSDYYFNYEDPSLWTTIELERVTESGETDAVFYLHALRKRNAPQSARFSDLPMNEYIRAFESGNFSPYSEARSIEDWCVTSLILDTEDPRYKKEFLQTAERFLRHVNGLVIFPEVMSAEEFRSFYSLSPDRPEEEIEPEFDEND